MSDLAEPLCHVLDATGYLANGKPAAKSVTMSHDLSGGRRTPSFRPDVVWRNESALTVYFKFVPRASLDAETLTAWQREVWNEGFSPLLWIIHPESTALYNGFGLPRAPSDVEKNRVFKRFRNIERDLADLDERAGRHAMETGQFWHLRSGVDRKNSVDRRLLTELAALETDLVADGLAMDQTQALIGRSIFAKFLTDREIVTEENLVDHCGRPALQAVLRDRTATKHFFEWLSSEFNGDMFPSVDPVPAPRHLRRVANFLDGDVDGQASLFPYRFDVIPVELISAIYEQFAHSGSGRRQAKATDVHYTPLAAVSLVLDEIMGEDLTGDETVLDITCGSGVFLVEALRRLVQLKARRESVTRKLVRETLHKQVFGVDISDSAIRVAAFSLYLAALELDPNPRDARERKFGPLIDDTLLVGDAHGIEMPKSCPQQFDLIVGNPPWSYPGRKRAFDCEHNQRVSPRGVSLDFVERAKAFAHDKTRFGMILSATPFFARSGTGLRAVQELVESLVPVTLVNLSSQASWLFPRANMPAMILLARHRRQGAKHMNLVQVPWSLSGHRSQTFELSASDVATLHIDSWKSNSGLLKAAFFGRLHDLLLLEDFAATHEPLWKRLRALDTALRTGLTIGNGAQDTSSLMGLRLLKGDGRATPLQDRALKNFSLRADLPMFDTPDAEEPRQPETFGAPLLIVREGLLQSPIPLVSSRPITAVSERDDTVFTNSYFGISFESEHVNVAHLLAGILSSALASWYFLLTGSTFALWKRVNREGDMNAMPTPDLGASVRTELGRRVWKLAKKFSLHPPDARDWDELDTAVFDLYGLRDTQRAVVRDGLFRASWSWKRGQRESILPAAQEHLREYALAFCSLVDPWFQAADDTRLRAEVYELRESSPLRAIRFVLEDKPPPSVVELLPTEGSLREVLDVLGGRMDVPVNDDLAVRRELLVTNDNEVFVVKPAARRHWLRINAMADARRMLAESFGGGNR